MQAGRNDLRGKVCLVTGATSGIGRATADMLARRGATVIVHGRNSTRVAATCREIGRAAGRDATLGVVAELSSLAEVRRLADQVLAAHARLDVLINNAGGARRRLERSHDGFEWQLAVNHLAPFLLTRLLQARLIATCGARIVNVASNAHRRGSIDFDDLGFERRPYSGLQAYCATKLANVLFTLELARRLEGSGVTANCLHPGVVATRIFAGMGPIGAAFGLLTRPFLLSARRGAETSVYLAASPEVAATSGRYFVDCRAVEPAPAARDAEAARRLWQVSATLVGID